MTASVYVNVLPSAAVVVYTEVNHRTKGPYVWAHLFKGRWKLKMKYFIKLSIV